MSEQTIILILGILGSSTMIVVLVFQAVRFFRSDRDHRERDDDTPPNA